MTLIRLANNSSIANELNHFFNNFGTDFFRNMQNYTFAPNFEVLNTDESYIVRADLPGLSKKDVNIKVSNNMITISGERKDKYSKDDSKYSDLSYGSFTKSFTLPEDALDDKITAKMKDGVLAIEVNRMKPIKPKVKTISIK